MTKRFKSTVLDSKLGTWQLLANYYKNQMQLQCSWNAKQEMKVLVYCKAMWKRNWLYLLYS